MRLIRRIAIAAAILLIFAVALFWFLRPHQADLSTYAPAESLVYLEANSLTNVASALGNTEGWKRLSAVVETKPSWPSPLLVRLSRLTGIGPVQTVVASRAQIALVVLNLGASEEGETLKVRPEAALIIETHTSSWRIKPLAEKVLNDLAQSTYGSPNFKKVSTNGIEYLIWNSPTGSRQIVATVSGSVVIVGNNETAVNACLAVRQGKNPSLRENAELKQMRARLRADQALAFGFISSTNSARLSTLAVPLLLGRTDREGSFGKLVTDAASKVVGAIGWSAFTADAGIEDRYHISLHPTVVARLRPAFVAKDSSEVDFVLPPALSSVSIYRFSDPLLAWQGLESGILSQLDALSAAVFRSLFKSALIPYGIENPEEFLALIGPKVSTVRLTSNSERSVVVSDIRNEERLSSLLAGRFRAKDKSVLLESSDGESAAAILHGKLYMGSADDVGTCIESLSSGRARALSDDTRVAKPSSATVVTYADDSERVRSFVQAFARASAIKDIGFKFDKIEEAVNTLPYAVTETNLADDGIERRTRSPLGQFGALATAMFPTER